MTISPTFTLSAQHLCGECRSRLRRTPHAPTEGANRRYGQCATGIRLLDLGTYRFVRPAPPDPSRPQFSPPRARRRRLGPVHEARRFDRYRVVEHRICVYCFSPDERFGAGTLGDGRLAYATGRSGQMFKFGAAMGERLVEAVTGRID